MQSLRKMEKKNNLDPSLYNFQGTKRDRCFQGKYGTGKTIQEKKKMKTKMNKMCKEKIVMIKINN